MRPGFEDQNCPQGRNKAALRTEYVRNGCYISTMENRTTTKTAADSSRSGSGIVIRPLRIEIPPINIDDLRDMVSRPLEFGPISTDAFNTKERRHDYK
jgi:hypothetical protein